MIIRLARVGHQGAVPLDLPPIRLAETLLKRSTNPSTKEDKGETTCESNEKLHKEVRPDNGKKFPVQGYKAIA